MFLKRMLVDQRGATAIEYGLLVALLAIAIIAALNTLGTQFSATFTTASDAMADS